MAIRSLTAPASYGHLCSSVIHQVNTRRQGIFPSVGIYTNVCNLCNYPFSVIHRQPKSSLQLTKALLVLSRNTIAIPIYLYILLGHISPSADQIDAIYRFCLAVSASTFALSFHQTHQLPTGMLTNIFTSFSTTSNTHRLRVVWSPGMDATGLQKVRSFQKHSTR